MSIEIKLEVHRDALTGDLQLSISSYDEKGSGTGYRIKGPKFSNNSKVLLSATLDADDVREIESYLKQVAQ